MISPPLSYGPCQRTLEPLTCFFGRAIINVCFEDDKRTALSAFYLSPLVLTDNDDKYQHYNEYDEVLQEGQPFWAPGSAKTVARIGH